MYRSDIEYSRIYRFVDRNHGHALPSRNFKGYSLLKIWDSPVSKHHVMQEYSIFSYLAVECAWRKLQIHAGSAGWVHNLSYCLPIYRNLFHNESKISSVFAQNQTLAQFVKMLVPFIEPRNPLSCSQQELLDPVLCQLNPVYKLCKENYR
jgi:hypothetical protein